MKLLYLRCESKIEENKGESSQKYSHVKESLVSLKLELVFGQIHLINNRRCFMSLNRIDWITNDFYLWLFIFPITRRNHTKISLKPKKKRKLLLSRASAFMFGRKATTQWTTTGKNLKSSLELQTGQNNVNFRIDTWNNQDV